MGRFLCLFMLCFTLPAFGQEKAPDLLIVPLGTLMRGKPTQFAILLDKTVTDLGYAHLIISFPSSFSNEATNNCCETYPNYTVALKDQWIISPGKLVIPSAADWVSTTASEQSQTGPFFSPGNSIPSGAGFTSNFKPSIDGPGELATFTAYSAPSYRDFTKALFGTTQTKSGFTAEFKDSQNFKMYLSIQAAPMKYDFRLFGDLNRDNTLNLLDISIMIRSIVGMIDLSDAETWYADLSPASKDGLPLNNGRYLGDGRIDVSDVTQALRVITNSWKFWWPDSL